MPLDSVKVQKGAAIVGLGAIGAFVGVVIGGAVGGPIGMAVGAAVGFVVGVGVGVVVYLVTKEKLVQERVKFDEEQVAFIRNKEQQEKEIKATKEAIELRERKAEEKEHKAELREHTAEEKEHKAELREHKAEAREAVVDQKLIDFAVQKINTVKDYVELMQDSGFSLDVIKQRLKAKPSFSDVFFEDDLRDPKTDEVLDDCIKAPDGYYYNRSTLVEIYQQAQRERKTAVCFKDPSKPLPDPVTLPIDQNDRNFHAKIQILRRAGLAEGLSLSSLPNPEGSKVVTQQPTLIEDVSMPSQADASQKKRFLRAPEGYCAFFIPEAEPAPSANVQPSLTAGEPVDVAVVVERQATEWVSV